MPTPTAQILPNSASATRRIGWWFGLPLLALTLLIGVSAAFTFLHLRDNIQMETQRTLTVIAEQKRQQLENLVAQSRIDAEAYFHSRSLAVILFSQWLDSGRRDRALLEEMRSRVETLARIRGWEGVTVFDAEARPVFSLGETDQEHRAQIQEVLRQPRIEFLDAHHHGQGPKLYGVLTPLGRPGSALLGVVLLSWRVDQTLYSLVKTWPVPTRTAETYLVRRDGDQVCNLTPLRFQPDAAPQLCWPVTADLPAARAARGERGFLADARDYRDVPVLAYRTAITGTPWLMIAEIDQDEAYAGIRTTALTTALVAGLTLLLLYAVSYALWRQDNQRRELAALQREQALQSKQLHTLQLLDAIANSTTDAIFAKDMQGRYLFLNRAGAAMIGKAVEEALGQDDSALFPPEQAARAVAYHRQVTAENRTITSQDMIATVHGEHIMLTTRGPLHDASGRVVGLFGIARDITELKAAETALQRAKAFADQLIESANVMVLGLDSDGQVLIFNAKGEEITGYSRQELLGQNWFATVIPRQRDAATPVNSNEAMVTGELPREMETTLWTRSGEPRRISWWSSLLFDPDGERISVLLGVDVTEQRAAERELADYRQDLERRVAERTADLTAEIAERRRVEEQLRQREKQAHQQWAELDAVYATAPVGLCVLDTGLRYRRINERLAEINGLPVPAHLGHTVREMVPDLADMVEPLLRRLIATGEPLLNLNLTGETAAYPGVQHTWREHFYPLKDSDGQVIGINGVVEDITEPKRIEQEIRELNANLERRVEERTAEVQAASAVLRESEERFRLAFNQVNTGMGLVDLQGKILQVNDKMGVIFGYSRRELEGMNFNDLTIPDDLTVSPAFIEYAMRGDGDSAIFEKRYRHRLGHTLYGQIALSLVHDAQRQPRYFIAQVQDITERKRYEQEIQQAR
ncbi:MAG: PAS domain S-box protein, partial [Candidatus Contendobacter sp.]|nr:PAS domain S-box protein [Candidatus Contendobacter sp.]